MALENKVNGLGNKAKSLALAGLISLTGAVQNAYSQVVLSFSGPTTVQVDVPTDYLLTIDTSGIPSENVANINWSLNLINGENATINSITVPASNTFFTGNSYSTNLNDTNSSIVNAPPYVSNASNLSYAVASLTLHQSGAYQLEYDFADAQNSDFADIPQIQTQTFGITAVPETSTYALAAGLGAAAYAVSRRKRKDSIK